MKKSFADMLASIEGDVLAKVREKLPDWEGFNLEYPDSLCLQQCSSSACARHKADIAARIAGPDFKIADLTGGLGADSFAFSAKAKEVWYNEMNVTLASAAKQNFLTLGADNISTNTYRIDPTSSEWEAALRAFAPAIIYLDPARRDALGKKVFLIEDCSPNIAELLPTLLDIAPTVMVKLSPMADISMVYRRLENKVQEVYITGLNGECKELLCIIGRGNKEFPQITVDEIGKGSLSFDMEDEAAASATYLEREAELTEMDMLLEPGAALMKAGCRKLLCRSFGIVKAGKSTQLYFSKQDIDTQGLFKTFRIKEILPLGKDGLKAMGSKYPKACVTAKNINMSSAELRKRLGVKDGEGGVHIFGIGIDYIGPLCSSSQRVLIAAERISSTSI